MKALAIHATRNTTKPDVTGAFIPEAKAFQAFHGGDRVGFDNKLPKLECRTHVERILGMYQGLDFIAFFCHGYRSGLQSGHDMATVGRLADAIAAASNPRIVVALYACSTAGMLSMKRGGFADALRDALTARGRSGHVDAHTVAGHCVWLPLVQRFDMGDADNEISGDWVVPPRTSEWPKWRKRLRADKDTLCYRYPLMSIEDVRAELRA